MARGPPRLRNLAPLPSDVYLEISHHVDRNTLTALNRASSTTHNATRTSLYRHIEVAATAPLLVSTLANNRALSEMVCSLTFPFVTRAVTNIVGSEWNEVLVAMIHLQHLAVQQYVHMDARIVSDIRFRLLSFSAGYALSRGWDTFVRAQLHIKTLTIYGFSLLLAGDLPTTFVNLEHVSATTHQASSFMGIYPLKSVRFLMHLVTPVPLATRMLERLARLPATVVKLRMICSHFITVDEVGPWLLALEELTLDEAEGNWNQRLAGLKGVALQLKKDNVPRLSSLRLVSRSMMFSGRRHIVASTMRNRSDLEALRTFTLCSRESCTKWHNWGAEGQTSEILTDCELGID
ncbi:hypothetical protein C8J57DRAFT_1252319 [Mycena rebaudengoi]|nr:hypothetical protein C8J57DRAFT_1252319 [Mycena rebaudengoi]